MLKLVRGIKLNTMKLRAENNSHFFPYCTTIQQPSKFLFLKQSITWKQAIRLFIEYGTVARLGERTEQSYARSVPDPIY